MRRAAVGGGALCQAFRLQRLQRNAAHLSRWAGAADRAVAQLRHAHSQRHRCGCRNADADRHRTRVPERQHRRHAGAAERAERCAVQEGSRDAGRDRRNLDCRLAPFLLSGGLSRICAAAHRQARRPGVGAGQHARGPDALGAARRRDGGNLVCALCRRDDLGGAAGGAARREADRHHRQPHEPARARGAGELHCARQHHLRSNCCIGRRRWRRGGSWIRKDF